MTPAATLLPTEYLAVREQMRPGDIIAFSGRTILSRVIQLFTNSPVTHCATVRQAIHADGPADVMVTESTINDHHDGPQTNPLGEILTSEYGAGSQAAWLPLREDLRAKVDWEKFYAFIGAIENHSRYDIEGLCLFAAKSLPFAGPLIEQSEDPDQYFCDAYCIAIFEAAGLLRGINYREMSPQNLCEMALYARSVPIFGKPLVIKNFNSL